MTSIEYIEGFKSGSQKAIGAFYESNLYKVTRWIEKNSGNADDALDVFQDGVESVIKKIFSGKLPENVNLEAYFFTSCKNMWFKRIENKSKEDRVRISEESRYTHDAINVVNLDKDYEEDGLKQMMSETFSKLTPTCQKLVTLLEKETKADEIAELLDMSSANTVYRRKFACFKSWRKYLEEHPFYEKWKYKND